MKTDVNKNKYVILSSQQDTKIDSNSNLSIHIIRIDANSIQEEGVKYNEGDVARESCKCRRKITHPQHLKIFYGGVNIHAYPKEPKLTCMTLHLQ